MKNTYIIETRAIGVGGDYRRLCYLDATNELHAIDIVYHDSRIPSLMEDNRGKDGRMTPLYVSPCTEVRAVICNKEDVCGVLPEYTLSGFVCYNNKNIGEI